MVDLESLYAAGLGELMVLHIADEKPFLGQFVKDKGRLKLRDRGLLGAIDLDEVATCFDVGICGAISLQPNREWESLTFTGPDWCELDIDLSATQVRLYRSAHNAFGERLSDFLGSVYRGYKLMLDTHIIPVLLMKPVTIDGGFHGLAVANLRVARVSMGILGSVYDHLSAVTDHYLTLDVHDVSISESEFDELFAQFRKPQ